MVARRASGKLTRRRFKPGVPCLLLLLSCTILLSHSRVFISAAVVTLDSIEIFKTHEWLASKPTVFFHCKGENKTVLPDVKKKHVLYTFKGEESWQPLTEILDKKCKRCGFYERDAIKSDDVFDEWEFCPSDFSRPDGKHSHFKEKEFNATFLCPECMRLVNGGLNFTAPQQPSQPENNSNGMHWSLILVIVAIPSVLFVVGLLAGYKFWQKRRRQQQQARFLQLFEEADDIEDELGISPLSHVV